MNFPCSPISRPCVSRSATYGAIVGLRFKTASMSGTMVLADTGSRALMPRSFRLFGLGGSFLVSAFRRGVRLALDGRHG